MLTVGRGHMQVIDARIIQIHRNRTSTQKAPVRIQLKIPVVIVPPDIYRIVVIILINYRLSIRCIGRIDYHRKELQVPEADYVTAARTGVNTIATG